MTTTKRCLTIVIVAFNSAHQMPDCLKCFADRGPDIKVRVRDNGSTDSTPRVLGELADAGYIDELILSPDDPGFAIAANDVIRRSGTDDILLVDPDSRVSLEAIKDMCDAIDEDPNLGLVTPMVRGGDDVSVINAGRQPRLWPMFTHAFRLSRAFPQSKLLRGRHLFLSCHSHEDQLVEWVSGCIMLIPRSTIDKVGILSERWFLYMDDTEYCQRVLDAGMKIKVLSKVDAFHEIGGSAQVEETDEPAANGAGDITPQAEPIDVSTMWGANLYDYYVQQFHPNAVTRLAWKVTFTAGNGLRAVVLQVRNPGNPKARHLIRNALAVWN